MLDEVRVRDLPDLQEEKSLMTALEVGLVELPQPQT